VSCLQWAQMWPKLVVVSLCKASLGTVYFDGSVVKVGQGNFWQHARVRRNKGGDMVTYSLVLK
jgi:hypothetical protein